MAHIQIGDISPRIQYTANGSVTTFAFPFPIFENSDLLVYLDGALQSSGYTVSGAGETAGGSAVFSAAPGNGVIVTLGRSVPIERTTDFQDGGAFRAAVINEELDRLVCMAQQLQEELGRTVRRPLTSTSTAPLDLPEPVPGRALKFGGDGALVLSNGDPDAAQSDAAAQVALATLQAAAAAAARTSAEAARDQVLALYDAFDDRYLGVHSVDPTTDNDGNPLFPGALYFQQAAAGAEGVMKVYTGSAWVAAYVAGADYLLILNALAELAPHAADARANIGAAAASDVSILSAAVVARNQICHVQGQSASGTGIVSIAAGGWVTRVLNTVVRNTIAGASLTSNVVTLPAGTYRVHARAPAAYGNSGTVHAVRVYDVTHATAVARGSAEMVLGYNGTAVSTADCYAEFVLATQADIRLEHRVSSTANGGVTTGFDAVEVYAEMLIERVA